ncbi:MAG: lactate utilization protein [Bacteroidota bacterium]|nr:MAG: lactate utilization protein [Bacteroidota bacterium]
MKETELKQNAAAYAELKKNISSETTPIFFRQKKEIFSDYDLATRRAAYYRWKSTESLDKLLIAFEANAIKAGIKVLWAVDTAQAHTELNAVIDKFQQHKIHIHTCYNELETEKLNQPSPNSIKNKISICDAIFVSAEPAMIACLSDKNFYESDVKIILASVDRLISSVNELELLMSLQSLQRNNQRESFSLISNAGNNSHKQEVYVLIFDNGRSKLLESQTERQMLHCIDCGICQTVCPVTESIGTTGGNENNYGPPSYIRAVFDGGQREFGHYAGLCNMCGKCNVHCPVHIDFKNSFLHLRHENVQQKHRSQKERLFYMVWKKTMLKREFMNWKTVNPLRYAVETLFLKSKTGVRKLPQPAAKSFNQMWREKMGMK